MWKEYANKHFTKLKQSKTLLVSSILATSAMFSSCENNKQNSESEQGINSMEDLFKPYTGNDYYGSDVKLYPVNVPVYGKDGNRLKDMYCTIYALEPENYQKTDSTSKKKVVAASYGTKNHILYLKVDKYNRVITEQGLVGLVVVENEVAVIAPENEASYINNCDLERVKNEQQRNKFRAPKKDSSVVVTPYVGANDSILSKDTIQPKVPTDSLSFTFKLKTDSLSNN